MQVGSFEVRKTNYVGRKLLAGTLVRHSYRQAGECVDSPVIGSLRGACGPPQTCSFLRRA